LKFQQSDIAMGMQPQGHALAHKAIDLHRVGKHSKHLLKL
jgi:hypothetical protein